MIKEKKGKLVKIKRNNNGMTDYSVYDMSIAEIIIGCLLGFVVGAVMLYVFFRIILLSVIAGVITGVAGVIIYQKHLKEQRKKRLLLQFRDLMESLVSSYSVGRNTTDAFTDARRDLEKIYGKDSDIVQEIEWILGGIHNQMKVEDMLSDLGERSDLEDISNFAMIFEVKGSGVDLKSLVAETREIIGDKIEIEQQIETMITSEKNELYVMLLMPVIMMLAFSAFSDGTMMANTPQNVLAKLVGLAIFALSYLMGMKIMDIQA